MSNPAPKTCVAPKTSTTICGQRACVTIKCAVPGGVLSGASCPAHVLVVKAMINEASLARGGQTVR